MSWYYKRYRPAAFKENQKGTCRTCGESIHFIFDPVHYDQTRRTKGAWAHEGVTIETFDGQDHHPVPKEFCNETVTTDDYDVCGSPVKYENIRAEDFACGRHMRKWEEEKAYRKSRAESDARKAERDALEEFEAAQYNTAAAWIKENFPALIEPDYHVKPHYGRLVRVTKIDVFVLYEFLKGIVEQLAGPEEEDNATDEDLAFITERPPPPWVCDRP